MTDCQAFEHTMRKKEMNLRLAYWALSLENFNYVLEHRKSTAMRHVDALSGNPIQIFYLQEGRSGILQRMRKAQQSDPKIIKLIKKIKKTPTDELKLSSQEILYKCLNGDELLVVLASMQLELIKAAHENGLFVVDKTEHIMKQKFWLLNMERKVKELIGNWDECILSERKKGKKEGYLTQLKK